MNKQKTKLLVPNLIDLSGNNDSVHIKILQTTHKFSNDAVPSGLDPKILPIFGCEACLDHKKIQQSYGLPFIRFKKGKKAHVKFINDTNYSFDIHWHGLNISADIDGASVETYFGIDTKIGKHLNIQFPKITNNSGLYWYHAHPMFLASLFVYSGIFGLLDIVDDEAKFLDKYFEYGNNHLMLVYQDVDFNNDGSLTYANSYTDEARSCFGMLNGISCMNWYSTDHVKYECELYHNVSCNLVKFDLLNATNSFRTIHLGICDKRNNIKQFYHIQSDTGLRNPSLTKMISLTPANRASILIDLDDFDDDVYLFLYNFDLTEVYNMLTPTSAYPDTELQITVPDIQNVANPSPNPTPIPNTDVNNPNPSNLIYPVVPVIPQVTITAENGIIPVPKKFTIKQILRLVNKSKNKKTHSKEDVIRQIRRTVFGENYDKFKDFFKINNFEYDRSLGINYVSLLNKKYFYNIPETINVPFRNFILFGDDFENFNTVGGNPNGSTECINGQNRIFVDMWNSKELDFSYALTQYNLNMNNFRPAVLPTCLFKIYPTDNEYMNYSMLANDTLIVKLYDHPIQYGDNTTIPLGTCTVIFPATDKPLNIDQIINLINGKFAATTINLLGNTVVLSNILTLDWTFYPYKISYITNKTQYIKTVMMKTTNKSNFYVSFTGKWQLLQFFGKTVGTGMMNMNMNTNTKLSTTQKNLAFVCPQGKGDKCTCIPKSNITNNIDMKSMMGNDTFPNNYNMNIQEIFAAFATSDPNNPITTYDDNALMIINANSTYYGFVDGFQTDSIMNFSVRKNVSEKWIYTNLDIQDTHPLHFHLTTGFVDVFDDVISNGLVSDKNSHFPYIYSRDTYGIGPQQKIAFFVKFLNYVSGEGLLDPPIRYLGYMYHCHYMTHHDMSMMGQYFVYENKEDFFS